MSGPTYIEIEERTDLSSEVFVNDYLNQHRPVIVRGGIAEWESVRTWSPEWFAQKYPDVQVPIAIGPRRRISSTELMPMSRFVELMESSTTHMYLRQFDLFRLLPELKDGAPEPALCPRDRQLIRNFWMGQNTLQPLHYDAHSRLMGTCNMFAQIYGKKKIILASPEQSPFLYERRGEQSDYHLSEVDIEAPDLRRFPLLKKATLLTGEVRGGDLCFVPVNFWHFMQAFGASISVSYWWHPHLLSHLAYQVLSLSSTPCKALKFAAQHEEALKWKDVEEVGGLSELRDGLQAVPEKMRNIVTLLFEKDIQTAVKAPAAQWLER